MRNFTSKQDFCSWLNEFESPILIPEWALHQNIVSVDPRGSSDMEATYVKCLLYFFAAQSKRKYKTVFHNDLHG